MAAKDDYLKDLFIDEVKGCLEGDGITEEQAQSMINESIGKIDTGLTEEQVQAMINNSLGVIENGTY